MQEIADAFGQRIIRVFEAVEAAAKYVLPTTVALVDRVIAAIEDRLGADTREALYDA